MRERQRRRSYLRVVQARKQAEADQITTIGMLLGARWVGHYFRKDDRGVTDQGIPYHYTTYFDKDGREITAYEALTTAVNKGKKVKK